MHDSRQMTIVVMLGTRCHNEKRCTNVAIAGNRFFFFIIAGNRFFFIIAGNRFFFNNSGQPLCSSMEFSSLLMIQAAALVLPSWFA